MKTIFTLITLVFLSCSLIEGDPENPVEELIGRRSAGLEFPDAGDNGGSYKMVNIAENIFVIQAYMEPSVRFTNFWRTWRIWKGKVGSLEWDLLPLPNDEKVKTFKVFKNKLYVATMYSGKLYRLEDDLETWYEMELPPIQASTVDDISFTSLDTLIDGLIWSRVSYGSEAQTYYGMEGNWKTTPTQGLENPELNIHSSVVHNGLLYIANQSYGVYTWDMKSSVWVKLPSARNRPEGEDEYSYTIQVHQGKIHVGYVTYRDGLYRLEDDGSWTLLTLEHPTQGWRETEDNIWTILSNDSLLITAGQPGTESLYRPLVSKECQNFGDWVSLKNYSEFIEGVGYQTNVWGMLVIGDTLYTSGWEYVSKIPIGDLDKMAFNGSESTLQTIEENLDLCED